MPSKKEYLYLTTQVDLPSGEKPDKPGDPLPLKRVGPGLLSEMDITDAQIKTLPRGVVRAATADEIEAGDTRATAAETRRIAEEAAAEQREAEIARANEKAAVAKQFEASRDEELRSIDEAHDADRAKAAEKTTAALNEAQGIEAAKTKRSKKED